MKYLTEEERHAAKLATTAKWRKKIKNESNRLMRCMPKRTEKKYYLR